MQGGGRVAARIARIYKIYLALVRKAMGRPFAACLGCIAMISQIFLGMIANQPTESILVRSVVALVLAAIPGWVIGKLADGLVRDNIEAHYRRRVEELKLKQSSENAAS